ncbi:MAG: molybdopterin cofactor-binding domain-containing protein, partial [Pseudomonadota bacterium]
MPIEFRKDLFADERDDDLNEIGRPVIRQDILGHVTGRTPFYDDHLFDGLLHMRCVRSPHHHARILRLDTQAAERMEGVVRVVLPRDVPHNINTLLSLIGFGRDDEQLLADRKVAYAGEPVCAVIATSDRLARAACAAVRVEWEVLPHVLDPEDALKPDAPVVNAEYPNNSFDYHDRYDHQKLRFGDPERAFGEADLIVEGTYQMSPIEQAPMETCGAIAAPEQNDRYVCYTSTQALFFSLGTTAKLLDMPSSRLHFIGGTVGGGFGGKVDSLHEPMAVLGARLTGRPVKFMWDRAEEMQVGAPRGAERWRIKDGVMRDGRIVARVFTGFFDAGAYTRLSSYAVQKGTGHLPGPYTIPNVASNVYCVFTNRTPATAMRGFGITGVDFAIECHMDKVAEAAGVDPIALRLINAYRDGDMKAHRRLAKNCALIESCQVAADKAGWGLAPHLAEMSSLAGGGEGWRGLIPETLTDEAGQIGARRARAVPAEPFGGAAQTARVPMGHATGVSMGGAEPQRSDMAIDRERIGHRVEGPAPRSAPPVAPTRP